MGKRFSRRFILAGLLSAASAPVLAQSLRPKLRPDFETLRPEIPRIRPKRAPNRIPPPSLDEIVKTFGPSGRHSIAVIDLESQDLVEGFQDQEPLPPASVMKAVTAIYGLRNLGHNFRFQTRLISSGTVVDGVLQGDLTLVANGDPALDTDGLAELVQALSDRGITSISGRFGLFTDGFPVIDQIDSSQPPEVGYNPSMSGLNLNFNRVYFEWQRTPSGYVTALRAKSRNFDPEVTQSRIDIVDREGPVFTYKAEDDVARWTVARKALGRAGSRWLPVRRPQDYALEVFRILAADKGINLPEPEPVDQPPQGIVLAQQEGAELGPMIRSMLKYSTNLTAEQLGITVSRLLDKPHRTLAQSAGAMRDWMVDNFLMENASLVDHSGLGDASRINATQMAGIFAREGYDGMLRPLLKPVILRDENWQKAPIHGADVVAKTGTLNFVSALGGYIHAPNGRKMAFAIFSADLDRRAAIRPQDRARPPGGRTWARKARIMQSQLLRRWILAYGIGRLEGSSSAPEALGDTISAPDAG